MKRIANLYKKDLILGIKDVFVILEITFAIIMTLLLVFVIPEDIRTSGKAYIYDQTKIVENFVRQYNPDNEEEKAGEYYVNSREEIIAGMTEDRSAVGIIISGPVNGRYEIEMLTQPYTSQAVINFIEIDLEDLLSILHPPAGIYTPDVYNAIRITALETGETDSIPFNQRILPPILFWMVGMMGVFAMVSIIGQERIDLTIRAFRLSPTPLWLFLLSKTLVMLSVGFITFSIFYIPLMGFSGYGPSLLVTMVTLVAGAALGIIIASFYASPMDAIGWVLLYMILSGLPAVTLLTPTFNPSWMRFIPSYYSLFGLDAAMFSSYNSSEVYRFSLLVLIVFAFVLIGTALIVFSRRIRKEV